MTRANLLRKLRELGACTEAIEWLESTEHATLQEAWDSCDCADWMLWLLARLHPDERRGPIRHAICDCAETALKYVTAGEDRPRMAIEVARRYADGKATDDELAAAGSAVGDTARAAWAAAWAAGEAAWAASGAAQAAWAAARAAQEAARAAAGEAAWAASGAARAAWAAAGEAAWAARGAALKDMAALIRKRVPNPEVI